MGYLHIENLYKSQEILQFRECYALEKIHGTSAHITWKNGQLNFFAGGESHSNFVAMFEQGKTGPGNIDMLKEKFSGIMECTVYGEAYGGKCMKMRDTYGGELKFIVFDVQIDGLWLAVPQAEDFAKQLGLEFVHYEKIAAEMDEIDRMMGMQSVQAVRNGCGEGKKREGVVLRPLTEYRKNNDARVISKHKPEEFRETSTARAVSPEKLKVFEDAKEIAEEWVTPMRIVHVLDKIEDASMENMREIIVAMCEDVKREGEGEIVWTEEVAKAVGKATAIGVKRHLQAQLRSGV